MDRANELVTGGHRLRDTQILAVLVFLNTEDNKGKLCQIQTGEVKTTIASLVAVLIMSPRWKDRCYNHLFRTANDHITNII